MDYNTSRSKLKLPEFGRNIQMMIEHTISIEDKEERTKAAESIIQVMSNMNPQLKDNRDFKHKLWDNLHMIAEFKLDINSPFDPPDKENLEAKPDALEYPGGRIKFKHFGKIVELMIEKAKSMEAGDSKDNFVKAIANHMKLTYTTWNNNSIPDVAIFKALNLLSNGELSVKEGVSLIEIKEAPKQQQQQSNKKKKGGKFHHKSSR